MATAVFDQINLVVRNVEASVAFYRRLGVEIPDTAIWRTPSGFTTSPSASLATSTLASTAMRWRGATTPVSRQNGAMW